MISIVIPLYNKEKVVADTIASIEAQTFTDYEVVVVDDGSSDKSVEVVKSFNNPKIRIIEQKNAGVAAARNRGIAEAHGEFVALLDSDDLWKPDFLSRIVDMQQRYPECEVLATNYECVNYEGKTIQTILNKLPFGGSSGKLTNYFEVASHSNPPICSSTVVIKKTAIECIGGFPVGVKAGEDLLTWARLACRFEVAYCRESMAIINIDGCDFKEKPKRIPAENDIVAAELKKLSKEFHPYAIKQYISHWYKMRSSIYMRLNMRLKSVKEAFYGIKYNPLNYKLYIFIALNLIPTRLRPF